MSEQTGKRLAGKVAIVTGAGRGIGRSEALLLAAEGAKVIVNDVFVENRGKADQTQIASRVAAEIRARAAKPSPMAIVSPQCKVQSESSTAPCGSSVAWTS